MQTTDKSDIQEEWIRILGKGMITIPKQWRKEMGMEEGEIVLARKKANQIVIEQRTRKVPYRIYSKKELKEFLKEDKISSGLALKLTKKYGKLSI